MSVVVEAGSYEFGMRCFEGMIPLEEIAHFGSDAIDGWLDGQRLEELYDDWND